MKALEVAITWSDVVEADEAVGPELWTMGDVTKEVELTQRGVLRAAPEPDHSFRGILIASFAAT